MKGYIDMTHSKKVDREREIEIELIYSEGYYAGIGGKSATTCPIEYIGTRDYRHWMKGYLSAQEWLASSEKKMNKCVWQCDEYGVWHTWCDHMFIINEGGPIDNSMKYCCFCGKEITEE